MSVRRAHASARSACSLRLLTPLLALLLLVSPARPGPDSVESETDVAIVGRGMSALPVLLAQVESQNAGKRLRARRLATRIVLARYRSLAPAGMRLVHGAMRINRRGVHLDGAFYLGVREVTRAEFAAFAKANDLDKGGWSEGDPAQPVVWVTQLGAADYARWKSARLPTLEELSNAATSFGRLRFPWGTRFDARFLNSKERARGISEVPGSCPRGRSHAGIDDLLGNVSEWTTTRTGKSKRFRVFGGSFKDSIKGRLAPFAVNRMAATARSDDVGFRIALSLPRLAPEPPRAPPNSGAPADPDSPR